MRGLNSHHLFFSAYLNNKGIIMAFDVAHVRAQFPMLSASEPIYLDNPAGTQVPQRVIDAMTHYLIHTNSNHGGAFRTTRESDAVLQGAHEAMADLLNAPSS